MQWQHSHLTASVSRDDSVYSVRVCARNCLARTCSILPTLRGVTNGIWMILIWFGLSLVDKDKK